MNLHNGDAHKNVEVFASDLVYTSPLKINATLQSTRHLWKIQ